MGLELGRGGRRENWVPMAARSYLGHVAEGRSIRSMAREAGVHPSTILRQVRRIEERRDDPLIDAALTALGNLGKAGPHEGAALWEPSERPVPDAAAQKAEHEAETALRLLAETEALLALADEMEKAVILRDLPDGGSRRLAIIERSIAEAMALRGWLAPEAPVGRVRRYRISANGRTALTRILAREAGLPSGFAEQQAGFAPRRSARGGEDEGERRGAQRRQSLRYAGSESPISALGRRKDKDGEPFLSDDLVAAAERLREDFELAGLGARLAQNWDWQAVIAEGAHSGDETASSGPAAARARLAAVMADLGPGLGDVALRCCCYLEGLETAEKKLGWSSRSGKIVLRIALQRLRRHYEARGGMHSVLIG